MPSVKQGGGYTLTFAKKNQDVKEHLDTLKENKVVITDYLCEAVRFFEKNKNIELQSNTIDHAKIESMIEEKIKVLMNKNIQENEKKLIDEDTLGLEEGLEYINDDEIEED